MIRHFAEQSTNDLIINSLRIYWQHFLTLFLIHFLPIVAFLILGAYVLTIEDHFTTTALVILSFFAAFFASGAMTNAVADICLDNKPTLSRSYSSIERVMGEYLVTFLLVVLITGIGLLLFIIPGIIAATMFMFSLTVVVVERKGGIESLRRSIDLGKEYYSRNFRILFLLLLLICLVGLVLMALFSAILGMIGIDLDNPSFLVNLLRGLVFLLPTPLINIALVLLYYDMRIRQEHYDAATLSQELLT